MECNVGRRVQTLMVRGEERTNQNERIYWKSREGEEWGRGKGVMHGRKEVDPGRSRKGEENGSDKRRAGEKRGNGRGREGEGREGRTNRLKIRVRGE